MSSALTNAVGATRSSMSASATQTYQVSSPAIPAEAGVSTTLTDPGDQNTRGLISGSRWTGFVGYDFPDAFSDYGTTYGTTYTGFKQVTQQQRAVVGNILDGNFANGAIFWFMNVEAFTNLDLGYMGLNNTSDISVAEADAQDGNNIATAHAYYPSTSSTGGDVWFGNDYPSYRNPVLGTYAWQTHLHELGHALGLNHGHEVGAFGYSMAPANDCMEFSVMSYRSYVGGSVTGGWTNETNGYAQTYMMYDIRALQTLYGADYTYNNTNTTYTWDPYSGTMSVNGVFQGSPGGNRVFMTIWDGGGNDTYDMSNYANGVTIDLTPGLWSTTSATQLANLGDGNFARGNVFNALLFGGNTASMIENAIGGSGNDTIVGNGLNNFLQGNAGNDTIYGYGGIDTVSCGDGNDYVILGNLAGNSSVVWGDAGDDTIYGGAGNDYLIGGDGNDVMVGMGGIDSLYGGAGDDLLIAGDGTSCVVVGGNGSDALWGGSAADYIVGDSGADVLVGRGGSDFLFGGAGDDTILGGSGTDYMYGDAGNDFFWTDDVGTGLSTDYIYVGSGTGIDSVADFTAGWGPNSDVLVISATTGVTSYAQLLPRISQAGVYTVVDFGADKVSLYGITPGQLVANNFVFA